MNSTDYQQASFLRRLGAMTYDSLLLFALLMLAALPVVLALGANSSFLKSPSYTIYLYMVAFLFFGWFWTRGGQTLGMRSWKLFVVNQDGSRLDWSQAFTRYLAATVSLSLLGLGFVWILIDPQKRAWHDILSNTRIIFNPDLNKKSG